MIKIFSKYFRINLGIDLGTANTVIASLDKGILINEPSIISYSKGSILAIGNKAKELSGKHSKEVQVIRPLNDGVIADFTVAEDMIQEFIKKINVSRFFLNHVVCGVPTGITPVEKRAVTDAFERSGAKYCSLVAEPVAAAIGAGLDISIPRASMIVDIGGGTTDIAVIAFNGIVVDNTIKLAGDELTYSIVNYLKSEHSLLIGEYTAEKIKISFGKAVKTFDMEKIKIKGLDTVLGQPKTIELDTNEIQVALDGILKLIIIAIKETIERTPPELVSDLIDYGIVMSGGGALIKDLDKYITESVNLPVHISNDPLLGVIRGTQVILENFSTYKDVLLKK